MEKKYEFIDASEMHKCYKCDGKGFLRFGLRECEVCKGTRQYKEEFFHLVVTKKDGSKIAFGVDQAGK